MVQENFEDLIQSLAYLDHEHGTDIALELTDLIIEARAEGLSEGEVTDLLNERLDTMLQNSVLEDRAHIETVEQVIRALPDLVGL
jgi:hypothetical protein